MMYTVCSLNENVFIELKVFINLPGLIHNARNYKAAVRHLIYYIII
jgi:hypothetical protein